MDRSRDNYTSPGCNYRGCQVKKAKRAEVMEEPHAVSICPMSRLPLLVYTHTCAHVCGNPHLLGPLMQYICR